MHELGIAQSIVEVVEREAAKHPGAAVRLVSLQIGEFSGVDTESLSFCFACVVKDTDLESARLEIERTPDDALLVARMELEAP